MATSTGSASSSINTDGFGDFTTGVTNAKGDKTPLGDQKELFLSLLVAQLKNQDPTSPMDQKDMMAQMAQMTSTEQLTNLAASMKQMQASATFTSSVALIGKTVDYVGPDGSTVVTGASVTGVTQKDGTTNLALGDGAYIDPARVVMVK